MLTPFEFNSINAVIDSDTALNQCLMNFSEDYIYSTIEQALIYRFRPYNTAMPNIVAALEQQFISIGNSIRGVDDTPLRDLRHRIYNNIIDIICKYYDLVNVEDTAEYDEDNFQLCSLLFQVLVTNVSDSFIKMLGNLIYTQRDTIVANMTDENRIYKTSYSKTILNDIPNSQNIGMIIDNVEYALDLVSGFDIDFKNLIFDLTGRNSTITDYICKYIADTKDIYKNKFICFFSDTDTRIDIITNVKIYIMNRVISEYPGVSNIEPYTLK